MTGDDIQPNDDAGAGDGAREAALARRIARAVGLARAALAWEVVWPRLVAVAAVPALFAAFAWLGLFRLLSDGARIAVLVLFAIAAVAVVAGAVLDVRRRRAIFDVAAARGRVEAASGLRPHDLTDFSDRLPEGAGATTQTLWRAHRRRLAARIGRLHVGWPRPDLPRRDRWALRPALGMLLFVAWFAADGEHLARLHETVRFTSVVPVPPRLDAWIEPPAHTGLAPIVLTGEAAREREAGAISVPGGSRLVVRVAMPAGAAAPKLELAATPAGAVRALDPIAPGAPTGGGFAAAVTAAAAPEASGTVERRLELVADGAVRAERDGRSVADWRFAIVPDRAPTITLVEPPRRQGQGATRLGHETDDDWGVVAAEAIFETPRGGHPLYEAPRFPLTLPAGRAHRGRADTVRDLSAHPFAGARLRLHLVARDAIGQEGRSEATEVDLPDRRYRVPLARAASELRRRLALDARERDAVATALDGLSLAPDRFGTRAGLHLVLRRLALDTDRAEGDEALRGVVQGLATLAGLAEQGDTAKEAEELAKAIEALREALRNGASDAEIDRLTRRLREALDAHLKAQAEAARRDPSRQAAPGGKQITKGDLDRMLDEIDKLGRTGSRRAAEDLLSRLDDLLADLKPQGSGSGSGSGEGGGGEDPLGGLSEMMRRQRKLMDDTHRGDREGGDAGDLRRQQDELRRDLDRLREGLARRPGEGDEATGDALGEAGREMGEAGDALGRGEGDEAVGSQGRALDALRRGARSLAERLRKEGESDGTREGETADDPLGRPDRGRKADGRVGIPDEAAVERARRILDDIRKRLSDPGRPRLERDYLDRLLKLD